MAALLQLNDSTVTLCNSKTKNLKKLCLDADIIVVAVGKSKLITSDMVQPKSIILDVGINQINSKIVGDVDFENCYNIVKLLSPVPGGVGPMTRAMLMQNILLASQLQKNQNVQV